MPFTPFHFGPGVLVKSLVGRRFWLSSFLAANVLIDIEVFYLIYTGQRPLHRFWHTYIGGGIAGIASGLIMFALISTLGPKFALDLLGKWTAKKDRLRAATDSLLAGLIGGVSHVFLDSLVHSDIRPFWPLDEKNELARSVPAGSLYFWLMVSGLVGGVIWLRWWLLAKD